MALRVEYETNYGITCEYAHCIIRSVDVEKKVTENLDNDTSSDTYNEVLSVTKFFQVKYDGLIYASEAAYEDNASPLAGFGFSFELNDAGTKQQYNLVKQAYLHLKEQDGFLGGVDC